MPNPYRPCFSRGKEINSSLKLRRANWDRYMERRVQVLIFWAEIITFYVLYIQITLYRVYTLPAVDGCRRETKMSTVQTVSTLLTWWLVVDNPTTGLFFSFTPVRWRSRALAANETAAAGRRRQLQRLLLHQHHHLTPTKTGHDWQLQLELQMAELTVLHRFQRRLYFVQLSPNSTDCPRAVLTCLGALGSPSWWGPYHPYGPRGGVGAVVLCASESGNTHAGPNQGQRWCQITIYEMGLNLL